MNKLIIALGLALVSSTAAFADSGALDVVGQEFNYTASNVDTQATAAIGLTGNVDATESRAKLGDGSPMVGVKPAFSIAIETGYFTDNRLGGNS